jgi:DUF4097 and DUF4098 domain-containing protein YvlB
MTMERTFETPGPVRLYVENEVGTVTITARETTTTEISLDPDTPGAQELVERATVEQRKDAVIVKLPRLHGMRFLRRNGVTIRIVLPEGSTVTAVTGSADVDVTGLLGAADLKTASGDLTTDDVTKEVRAKTASGDVTVGSVGGELRMSTASGCLRCSRVGGRATFSAASGDVEIGSAGDRVEVQATSGHVRLGELARGARVINVSGDIRVLALSEGSLHVRSVSGDVAVGVAEGVELHVDVETVSGQIRSGIPLGDQPGQASRTGKKADVSVRNVSGNVEIERALEQVA